MNSEASLMSVSKKRIFWIFLLLNINAVFFIFLFNTPLTLEERIINALLAHYLVINLLGFIIGIPFGFIPFKEYSYRKRYLRSSLIVILVVQLLFFIGNVLVIFMDLLL